MRFAIAEQCCLFTFNRGDFVRLHSTLLGASDRHCGLVVAPQAPIGTVVRALAQLLSRRSGEDLRDQLVWLLRRPIHVAKRGGVTVVVMLRSLVIGHDDFLGREGAAGGTRLRHHRVVLAHTADGQR